MKSSRIDNYIKFSKKIDEVKKFQDDNHYVQQAILMMIKLQEAKRASVRNELSCKGIQVVVGHQYYRGEKSLSEIVEEHTGGALKVKIDHYDHWSGDDHDVSYIYVPVKDLNDKQEMRLAFKTLKAWAPNVKLSVSFEESW